MKLLVGGIAVVALAACGKVEDPHHLADAPTAPKDGALDDAPPADAMPDASPPRCDPSKPFGTPVTATELNGSGQNQNAELSPDELTVVYSSNRTGGVGDYDLYIATRTSTGMRFGTPSLLAGVNTTGRESRAIMTDDGLALYAETQVNPNAPTVISRATRASTSAAFGALGPITGINGGQSNSPWINGNASALYFSSDRVTTNDFNLYTATGTAGSFTTPAILNGTNLATASSEGAPTLTADQLTMYFASNRAGNSSFDIWMTTRGSLSTGFGDPILVSALSTGAFEVPTWVSPDNCVIYFYRDVGAAAPSFQIFRAVKPL